VDIHWMNGIPPGLFGFWTRNSPEEWNSAGITGSWTWIQIKRSKIFLSVTIPKNLNMKTSI
jgi:hypothetical protein